MTPAGPGAAGPGGQSGSGPVPPETGPREVQEEERPGRRRGETPEDGDVETPGVDPARGTPQ